MQTLRIARIGTKAMTDRYAHQSSRSAEVCSATGNDPKRTVADHSKLVRKDATIVNGSASYDTPKVRQSNLTRADLGFHILTAGGTFKSVRPVAITLGIGILGLELFYGFRDGDWNLLISDLHIIFLVWFAAIGFLILLVKFMRVRVFSKGIEGRSYGGFRRRFLWEDIAGIRFSNSIGMAALIIVDKVSKKEMWMLREIAERQDFQLAISPYIRWKKLEVFG